MVLYCSPPKIITMIDYTLSSLFTSFHDGSKIPLNIRTSVASSLYNAPYSEQLLVLDPANKNVNADINANMS